MRVYFFLEKTLCRFAAYNFCLLVTGKTSTEYAVRRQATLMQLDRKCGDFFLLAFIQVKSEDFLKIKTNRNMTPCSVRFCHVYALVLANTKVREPRQFQVRNPNPHPSGSPGKGFPHTFHPLRTLHWVPQALKTITNPLPQRQSNSAGCNYS